MPSNAGSAQDAFDASFFILPPLNHEAYRPAHTESPWSASSHNLGDHLSLTLPSITPGDLAENSSLFYRLQSPSNLLSEAPISALSQRDSHRSSQLSRPRPVASHSLDPFSASPVDLSSLFGSPPPQVSRASSIVDLTESSPGTMAPQYGKRERDRTLGEPTSAQQKKRRTTSTPKKESKPKEENVFRDHSSEEIEQVDLVDVDDDVKYADYRSSQQAAMLKQQQEDDAIKYSKLSKFTCIICLDNPTDLSVTACGHMFCSLCLHEALTAVPGRRICPVCRSNVGKTQPGKDPPKNGVFPLTMKLMTTNKKGKQPVRGK